jgi:hypothetical protein
VLDCAKIRTSEDHGVVVVEADQERTLVPLVALQPDPQPTHQAGFAVRRRTRVRVPSSRAPQFIGLSKLVHELIRQKALAARESKQIREDLRKGSKREIAAPLFGRCE